MASELGLFLGIFFLVTIMMLLNLALAEWFYEGKFRKNKRYRSQTYEMIGGIGKLPLIVIFFIMGCLFMVSMVAAIMGARSYFIFIVLYYLVTLNIMIGKTYRSVKKNRNSKD
jgi:hypothetical protein